MNEREKKGQILRDLAKKTADEILAVKRADSVEQPPNPPEAPAPEKK